MASKGIKPTFSVIKNMVKTTESRENKGL